MLDLRPGDFGADLLERHCDGCAQAAVPGACRRRDIDGNARRYWESEPQKGHRDRVNHEVVRPRCGVAQHEFFSDGEECLARGLGQHHALQVHAGAVVGHDVALAIDDQLHLEAVLIDANRVANQNVSLDSLVRQLLPGSRAR
ncbi:hypothetical protein HJ588_06730 [Flexivirga sp. ID2601S]|uniref:Uncharacterized protein n=1 Tax=Flexivirga aerilata TaxID=1656889 RepID=A0A849AEP5_9MICO|nr:hypothetical protein [Flexivirga aerilata]NNG38965.1 hypothetical protein [Flexivirga aerilata]